MSTHWSRGASLFTTLYDRKRKTSKLLYENCSLLYLTFTATPLRISELTAHKIASDQWHVHTERWTRAEAVGHRYTNGTSLTLQKGHYLSQLLRSNAFVSNKHVVWEEKGRKRRKKGQTHNDQRAATPPPTPATVTTISLHDIRWWRAVFYFAREIRRQKTLVREQKKKTGEKRGSILLLCLQSFVTHIVITMHSGQGEHDSIHRRAMPCRLSSDISLVCKYLCDMWSDYTLTFEGGALPINISPSLPSRSRQWGWIPEIMSTEESEKEYVVFSVKSWRSSQSRKPSVAE